MHGESSFYFALLLQNVENRGVRDLSEKGRFAA